MTSYSDIRKSIEARKEFCASLVHTLRNEIVARPGLNAFVELFDDTLDVDAQTADTRSVAGNARGLEGMLVGIKDNILIRGRECTAASRMLKGHRAAYDATVVRRLREAGAVIAGRLNMDEFAMGSSGETSVYGPTQNPAAEGRIPGGSSSGSAAAVAAGLLHAALGSDTGGSVRQPAACTGTIGIKPTYGRVSRSGLISFASSCDQIGVIAGTAEDAARVLHCISGHDTADATSSADPVTAYVSAVGKGVQGLRIGIIRECLPDELPAAQHEAIQRSAEVLTSAGATVDEILLPLTDLLYPVYAVIANAEAASNLSRYNGMRYGHACNDEEEFHTAVMRNRSEGFGREVKRRIMIGTYVLSAGYRQQWFEHAARLRRRIRDAYRQALSEVDLLLLPVMPGPPAPLGELMEDPLRMYRSDMYTVAANLTGLPAISVPAGRDGEGLPLAVQFMASAFREDLLFASAGVLEGAMQ
ncbi:MAG: Asp-tRNA(Asn)/Glu-tRNA(Gln) amidotransferase subunit GatA [Bacteroidetes bacterium]|nr:Asp-tRNA(Asn)/Glu-tRNA(Gln) amidotransferase subunit GatA [Bacteroidota bacterium]